MSNQYWIFIPLLAQVILTIMVWLWMYKTRITEMKIKKIRPQELATTSDAAKHLSDVVTPSENFTNLFEVPVLFYVAVLTLFVTQSADTITMALACLFVALRYVHSFIHVTYNQVMHRFLVYIAGALVLYVLWVAIAIILIERM